MSTILVIGASGFVGGRLARKLRTDGHAVRCLARDPARVAELAALGCEVVRGDIADAAGVRGAMIGVSAVYISIHTLSPQPGVGRDARFMDAETIGITNVLSACGSLGVRRIVYVTSLGIAPDARSEWLRERWKTEQLLLGSSDADATVIRPGMIVGRGGRGFDTAASQARRRIAFVLGRKGPSFRTIAIDDLIAYLLDVLDEPRTFGQRYDVGSDDVLSMRETVDAVATILGRKSPIKLGIPLGSLAALATPIERIAKVPRGVIRGFIDSASSHNAGDPSPIRAVFPRSLLSFHKAAERALKDPSRK